MNGRMAIKKRKRTISKEKTSLKKWKVTPHKGEFVYLFLRSTDFT